VFICVLLVWTPRSDSRATSWLWHRSTTVIAALAVSYFIMLSPMLACAVELLSLYRSIRILNHGTPTLHITLAASLAHTSHCGRRRAQRWCNARGRRASTMVETTYSTVQRWQLHGARRRPHNRKGNIVEQRTAKAVSTVVERPARCHS
jgi:hypothetical protein